MGERILLPIMRRYTSTEKPTDDRFGILDRQSEDVQRLREFIAHLRLPVDGDTPLSEEISQMVDGRNSVVVASWCGHTAYATGISGVAAAEIVPAIENDPNSVGAAYITHMILGPARAGHGTRCAGLIDNLTDQLKHDGRAKQLIVRVPESFKDVFDEATKTEGEQLFNDDGTQVTAKGPEGSYGKVYEYSIAL